VADKKTRLLFNDFSGGLNQYDPPWALKANECVDAVNVDFFQSRVGRRRNGCEDRGAAITGTTLTGIVSSLFKHVPGTDYTLAELWAVDDAGTPNINRVTLAGAAWNAPTLKDNPTGNGWDFSAASINSLFILAYKSAQNRLHAWDGSTVRRTGLAAMPVPTVANTGAGTYPAVARFYRTRAVTSSSGVIVRRSEPSPSVSFTPSGGGTAARVTQGTPPNEGENFWEVEGSTDGVIFYRLYTVAIGTTFVDDTSLVTFYALDPLSDATGKYTLQKPYKFVAADQGRVIGFSSWNTADKQNDLEFSAVVGSLDVSDVERVDTTTNYRLGLDENDGGIPTGLCGPVGGSFFAFKDRQIWKLTPTGQSSQPYRADAISKVVGAIEHTAIAVGEDQVGNPAIYFLSHRGPYRWTQDRGLEYLGRNIEPQLYDKDQSLINLDATHRIAVTVYHQDKRQVWFWWAQGSQNDPTFLHIYNVLSGGWSNSPGSPVAKVRCACLFTAGSGVAKRRQKPWIGQTGGNYRLWRADADGVYTDVGTFYSASLISPAIEVGAPGFEGEVGDLLLLVSPPSVAGSTQFAVTVTADFGIQTRTLPTLDAAAIGSETRVTLRIADSALAGIRHVQYTITDVDPNPTAPKFWQLDSVVVPVQKNEALTR
jgi:hypothetical protein